MRTHQATWRPSAGWDDAASSSKVHDAQLVFAFGGRSVLQEHPEVLGDLAAAHPNAVITGCSTSGEISGTHVGDASVVATAIQFERTDVRVADIRIPDGTLDFEAGSDLARQLPSSGLRYVTLLSDGLHVNGSSLVRGLVEGLPDSVVVTGGLAGDGDAFGETVVVLGDTVADRRAVAVGYYGDALQVGHGCLGGWDSFGPERVVTRSQDNVLYELDGRSALDLYKSYLGDYADELPSSALLFPLSIRLPEEDGALVRTILAVDDETNSMTFAGDIPTGARARFMMANFDRLIDGAHGAAGQSIGGLEGTPDLALLISCVGRRLVLDQRVEEELEGVREAVGEGTTLCGFYSYGEVSPLVKERSCELHNQTMTITTFAERL